MSIHSITTLQLHGSYSLLIIVCCTWQSLSTVHPLYNNIVNSSPFTFVSCMYTVKKCYRISRPLPGCHLPNSPWPGIIKLFPTRESLVIDISAGDGKIINLFYSASLYAITVKT